MKSKKRHHRSSSEESDLSEITFKSSSSSGSDTDGSSASEHKHKKKKKRAESSDSESESDDQKRVKKRKHKKKKKKHGKKKRRTESVDESASELEEISSISEGELEAKKKRKHKHKHSKRTRDSLARETAEEQVQRRIHSVVKERRDPSDEAIQPSRTYYQKEYRRSESVDFERQREVQRFYRGSSKDRKQPYQEPYNKEHSDRYGSYQQDKFDKNRDKYGQYHAPHQEHDRRPREYNEYKRNPRYEDNRPPDEEFQRRPREDAYNPRQEPRAPNRYNSYEERGPKRREFVENREYRDNRRMPPEVNRIQNREYQERKERFREEPYNSGRPREPRRDNREGAPSRDDRLPAPPQQNLPRPRSPDERYRERNRRQQQEPREEKQDRYRDGRGDRKEQPRNEDRKPERNREEKIDPRTRERKSRFTDAEEEKDFKWGKDVKKEDDKKENEKEMPNFGLSGKLTAEANTVNGVVIKYTEPDDAKQPKRRWRFYPFKGDKALPILYIHRQSAFLIGRDKKVTDITLEHPSISKQHAVLQFRATPFTRPDGTQGRRVRPYIIDLESANGTFVNNKKIEPRRYVELLERDVVKYGFSQREYVLLHENSKDDAQDDDNQDPPALGASVTTTDQIKHEKRIKQEAAADGE